MGEIQASIVVGCDAETAAEKWTTFDFRQQLGQGPGLTTPVAEAMEQDAEEERVRFEDRADGSSLVVLTVEYDEDVVDDVPTLRAEVEDELARYREYLERDAA